MSKEPQFYYIEGSISTTGNAVSVEMSHEYSYGEMSWIHFFDAESADYDNKILPASGSVVFDMSADGYVYRDVTDGTFDANLSDTSSRKPPRGNGFARRARVSVSSMPANARYFRACVWRL